MTRIKIERRIKQLQPLFTIEGEYIKEQFLIIC